MVVYCDIILGDGGGNTVRGGIRDEGRLVYVSNIIITILLFLSLLTFIPFVIIVVLIVFL